MRMSASSYHLSFSMRAMSTAVSSSKLRLKESTLSMESGTFPPSVCGRASGAASFLIHLPSPSSIGNLEIHASPAWAGGAGGAKPLFSNHRMVANVSRHRGGSVRVPWHPQYR
jgi:hypothetical protein